MKSDFSEFSYGYSVTDELINWYGTPLTAVPIFPSLLQEGRGGGGYDVLLNRRGKPLFLQFKCSRLMKGKTAKARTLGLFNTSYYRMDLRPTRYSDQHPLLLDLEGKGNEVYYIAPAFHLLSELNQAYLGKRVISSSVFFRPFAIGSLPDDEEHYIAFQKGGMAFRLSEPSAIDQVLSSETFTRHFVESLEKTELTEQALENLEHDLIEMVSLRMRERGEIGFLQTQMHALPSFEILQGRSVWERIAYFARTFLDCAFFVVTNKPTSP